MNVRQEGPLGLGLSTAEIAVRGGGLQLAFVGSRTLAENITGVVGTLVVSNAAYDTFTELTDPDNKFTLNGATDEISVSGLDFETKTSHVSSYSASSSSQPLLPTLTLTITWTVTDVVEGGALYVAVYLSMGQY